MRRSGVPPPPPPLIIFERLTLPQQIIYRRKENLSESPNHLRDWSLLIPGTGAEGNIIFSQKNSLPIQISLQIFIPHLKIFQNFHTPTCTSFYVLIIFTIFKNPIENRFKHKHLTATHNLIALSLKESSHINYVQY